MKTYFAPAAKPPYVIELPLERKPDELRVLEISTRSPDELGRALSAMRLRPASGGSATIEAAYQGAKDYGEGPSRTISAMASGFDAKRASKTRQDAAKGEGLVGFTYQGKTWPAETLTDFYDWLWTTSALISDPGVANKLKEYDGFSDMFHEGLRGGMVRASQAMAAATLVSLARQIDKGRLSVDPEQALSPDGWQTWRRGEYERRPEPAPVRPTPAAMTPGAQDRKPEGHERR